MIVFFNFAPIEFMGGAEKWIFDVAQKVGKKEKTVLLCVSSSIANVYGRLVLKRKFTSNKEISPRAIEIIHLSGKHFLPFTKEYQHIKSIFSQSRIVYTRFEIVEILLLNYFAGLHVFTKVIAGLHLNIRYYSPTSIFQKLHNVVYSSFIYKFYLRRTSMIHVPNKRDKKILEEKFSLNNVYYLPLGTSMHQKKSLLKQDDTKLQVIYVGELSLRKGTDTLLAIMRLAPSNFYFHIVGNGPLKKDVDTLAKEKNNVRAYGFVPDEKLESIYEQSDVLVFPSRAEGFGLVMIEAMSYGLRVINSFEVSLQLPSFIETTITHRIPKDYMAALNDVSIAKKNNTIDRGEIMKYALKHFSIEETDKVLEKDILHVHVL